MIKANIYQENEDVTATVVELGGEGETVYTELRALTEGILIRLAEQTDINPLDLIDIFKEAVPEALANKLEHTTLTKSDKLNN